MKIDTIDEAVSAEQALASATRARQRLAARAAELRAQAEPPEDQAFPVEALVLNPTRPTADPLFLLGGMGPVAGLDGFELAVRRFGDTRCIVLLQACDTPDRTVAVRAGRGSTSWRQVTMALDAALERGLDLIESTEKPTTWLVLCNSAHAFLPDAIARFDARRPERSRRLRWISIVDAAARMAAARGGRALLAATTGARLSGVYAQAFAERGLALAEPDEPAQAELMRAIYQGVKGFDEAATLEAGAAFFRRMRDAHPRVNAAIAGCTETPAIIEGLRAKGPRDLRDYLATLEIIEPMTAALARV